MMIASNMKWRNSHLKWAIKSLLSCDLIVSQATSFRTPDVKLAPQYFGMFEVDSKSGSPYRLKLPMSSHIHPVFHVSLLKDRSVQMQLLLIFYPTCRKNLNLLLSWFCMYETCGMVMIMSGNSLFNGKTVQGWCYIVGWAGFEGIISTLQPLRTKLILEGTDAKQLWV